MGFTSLVFLFAFLPFSILIYYLIIRSGKRTVCYVYLIGVSLVFYSWTGLDTLVLFVMLVIFVYALGCLAYYTRPGSGHESRKWLAAAVGVLAGILFYYKYVPVISEQFSLIPGSEIQVISLVVPIGISFIIFESISYVADIYRGEAEPGDFLDACLFLTFFPKLISGPIVRWKDFSPPVFDKANFSVAGMADGIGRIAIGLCKKAVIADTFASQIALIQAKADTIGIDTPTLWLQYILFFFQIYYDFSGYSDVAIGISKIFGIEIKENFNFPYISRSISEFWRRWHISLGTWFREYIYIPLGGNRRGNVYLHLFIVFLITGIWHGANLTFIVWGCIHGACVMAERAIRNKTFYRKIPSVIKWIFTMIVVFFAWIIFMSPTIEEAFGNIGLMFTPSVGGLNFRWTYYMNGKITVLLIVAAAGAVFGALNLSRFSDKVKDSKAFLVVKRAVSLGLLLLAVLFIVNSTYSPFLYFQF